MFCNIFLTEMCLNNLSASPRGFESHEQNKKIKSIALGNTLHPLAESMGFDGLCPSFATQTPIVFGFAEGVRIPRTE